MRLLLRSAVLPARGDGSPSDLLLEDGVFRKAALFLPSEPGDRVIDLSGYVVLPGFADVHVHLRQPGFSYKETIETGTLAAARGGYTTVCPMPNLNPAPDSPEHLEAELELIRRDARIAAIPYAAISVGRAGRELVDYGALAPLVAGFSDDGSGVQDESFMRRAMRGIRAADSILAAHCEDESLVAGGYVHAGGYARSHGHAGISSESEWRPIERDLKLVRETGCRYHVCHVSAKESVALIRAGKKEGLDLSCETAPHYLLLDEGDLREEGRFKMNPPLRGAEDREALIEGILDGTIDMIATDHAPHAAAEKAKGLAGSAMGVTGLDCAFQALYTGLVRTGILSLKKLVFLLSEAPRARFRLPGGLRIGEKADLSVWDLNAKTRVDPAEFCSHGKSTPFAGRECRGENLLTMWKGETVWSSRSLRIRP